MIKIVDTGVANIRSLIAAFERLGQAWSLTDNPAEIVAAEKLVLPGVGRFAAAVNRIDELNLRDALAKRIQNGRPTLCICLGLHLLCRGSEESPNVHGLGILDQQIRRFGEDVQVPQLGWNEVRPIGPKGDSKIECDWNSGMAYFANSYRLTEAPAAGGWNVAETEYGGKFISAIWKGDVLACQFHPELSGAWGQELIAKWLGMQNEQTVEQASNIGDQSC